MLKLFSAIAGAALIAGMAVAIPGATQTVEASTPLSAKADRLDYRPHHGTACSQRGWPYFEADCLRNTNGTSRVAPQVRLVSTDRVR